MLLKFVIYNSDSLKVKKHLLLQNTETFEVITRKMANSLIYSNILINITCQLVSFNIY